MRTRTAPIRQITIKHYPGDLVVASSASFVSALRAESAVAPLLLLSPANPLTLGFPGAPKAEPPPFTQGRLWCVPCGSAYRFHLLGW